MSKPNSPCYNCKERHENCHSDCGKYLDFQIAIHDFNRMIKNGRIEDLRMRDVQWLVYRKHHHGTQRTK